jgi:hypothetical protein
MEVSRLRGATAGLALIANRFYLVLICPSVVYIGLMYLLFVSPPNKPTGDMS